MLGGSGCVEVGVIAIWTASGCDAPPWTSDIMRGAGLCGVCGGDARAATTFRPSSLRIVNYRSGSRPAQLAGHQAGPGLGWISPTSLWRAVLYMSPLKDGIMISMDGKGSWRDKVFVERLWRSVKYEEIYLRAYDTVNEARA